MTSTLTAYMASVGGPSAVLVLINIFIIVNAVVGIQVKMSLCFVTGRL